MNIRYAVCGWVELEVGPRDRGALLDLCMRYGVRYIKWRSLPNTGGARFYVTANTAALLCRRCAEEGICLCTVRRGGLPHLLKKYRRRWGLVLGMALGLLLFFASTRVLWDIRISGNEQWSESDIRQELRQSGIYIGMPLSSLDPDQAKIRLALDSDKIAWVAINLSGTVANIEIRERVATPPPAPKQPANLIASYEGIVEGLEVYTGNVVVKTGQPVRQGDLLVSGVYDSQAIGWRVTRASGRVLARTVHDFSVEIPLLYREKVYDGKPIYKKTLFFFEKEIKLFKNSGILGTSCDKIDTVDRFTLGEGVTVPIWVCTTTYHPYTYQSQTRDHETALELAYEQLAREIAEALPEASLLRKQVTTTLGEESVRLDCRVWCLENIAQTQEFEVETLLDH